LPINKKSEKLKKDYIGEKGRGMVLNQQITQVAQINE